MHALPRVPGNHDFLPESIGRISDPKHDAMLDAMKTEMDVNKRDALMTHRSRGLLR